MQVLSRDERLIRMLTPEASCSILLEQRYYGQSMPFTTLNTDNFRFLDTEQALADNVNFAKNIKLPELQNSITAPGSPWIVVRQTESRLILR